MLPPVKAFEKRLFITIARGYLYRAEILKAGVTTSCTNNRQETPIYLAVGKSKLTVVDLLIRRGANVSAQCGQYGNALYAASARGHEQVARLLVENSTHASPSSAHQSRIPGVSHNSILFHFVHDQASWERIQHIWGQFKRYVL